MLHGDEGGLRAAPDIQLLQHVVDVALYRAFSDAQPESDFFVRFAFRDQHEDFTFPLGQLLHPGHVRE